jgi:hypothetical protein
MSKIVDLKGAFASLDSLDDCSFFGLARNSHLHDFIYAGQWQANNSVSVSHHQITRANNEIIKKYRVIDPSARTKVLSCPSDTESAGEDWEPEITKNISIAHAAIDYQTAQLTRPGCSRHDLTPIAVVMGAAHMNDQDVTWLRNVDSAV